MWSDGYIHKRDCFGRAIIRLYQGVEYATAKRADLTVGTKVHVCVDLSTMEVAHVLTPDEMDYLYRVENEPLD